MFDEKYWNSFNGNVKVEETTIQRVSEANYTYHSPAQACMSMTLNKSFYCDLIMKIMLLILNRIKVANIPLHRKAHTYELQTIHSLAYDS